MSNLKRIIYDTDPGIDDAMALMLALASPELQLEAITIAIGNSTVEQETQNALSILELLGITDIPVAKGVDRPLVQPLRTASETHGEAGLGYATLPLPSQQPSPQHAVDLLIERLMAEPGEITVVATGALTNLALAIRKEPRLVQAVQEVIIMGGAFRHEGNTTPMAEYNVYVDPHAAHIVYHSGMPITLVPLDVTYQCLLTQFDLDRLLAIESPVTQFLADMARFYLEFHGEYQQIAGCALNDPLAMALTFMPELVKTQSLYVTVDIHSELSLGTTMADFFNLWQNPPNMEVALAVEARQFIDMFVERMINLALSR